MTKRTLWGYLVLGSLAIIGSLVFFAYINEWDVMPPEDTSGMIHCSLDFGDGYVANISLNVPQNEHIYLNVSVPYDLASYYSPPCIELAKAPYMLGKSRNSVKLVTTSSWAGQNGSESLTGGPSDTKDGEL